MNAAMQRTEALESANEIRMRLAALKRHMSTWGRVDGPKRAAAVLVNEPALLCEMTVHVFLSAIPGFGRERVRTVCQRLPVWPFRTVGELTDRERRRLACAILGRPL